MNILFLSLTKIDDINQRGIYPDLLRDLIKRGHRMYIVSPLERRYGRKTQYQIFSNYSLLNVRTLNIQKTNIIEKGIGIILLEIQYLRAISKYLREPKFDLILYATPPITLSKIINKIKHHFKSPTYLLLKDIFPQNAVDMGMMSKSSLLYRYFRKREKKLYQISDYIGCMSNANVQYLINNYPYLDPTKIEVCPNSIELQRDITIINKTKYRKKYCIPDDCTIFIYGGNLGKPQGLDFLITILESNSNKKDRYFIIIGSGTEYEKLSNWFETKKPENAILLNTLSKDEFDALLRSCDVGLIFLDPRFTIPNYPSRLLSYLEYSMPVLMATDLCTDIGSIAQENGYGLWCESGDLTTFNSLLDQLILNKSLINQMGKKGYQYLLSNYQAHISANIILSHF